MVVVRDVVDETCVLKDVPVTVVDDEFPMASCLVYLTERERKALGDQINNSGIHRLLFCISPSGRAIFL